MTMMMCYRELYELPWDRRRFSQHRARVQSAGPRIDCSPPSSAGLAHVRDKRKKGQQEKERQAVIQVTRMVEMIVTMITTFQSQNLIMLQHLSHIARSKRVDDGNMKKMHWKDFYLQIMVNPRYWRGGFSEGRKLGVNLSAFYCFHVL